MAAVNGISSVDICTNSITFTSVVTKYFCLVGTSVCSQYRVFVDIVSVCPTSSRVIFGKAKGIKILGNSDGWMKIVVVIVCWRREV